MTPDAVCREDADKLSHFEDSTRQVFVWALFVRCYISRWVIYFCFLSESSTRHFLPGGTQRVLNPNDSGNI